MPQDGEPFFTYHVEHIIARRHGGGDNSENLAFACYHCNLHKGPDLSGIDQESGALVRLFNPREDKWDDHFEQNGVVIAGRTAIGRATIGLLKRSFWHSGPSAVTMRTIYRKHSVKFEEHSKVLPYLA